MSKQKNIKQENNNKQPNNKPNLPNTITDTHDQHIQKNIKQLLRKCNNWKDLGEELYKIYEKEGEEKIITILNRIKNEIKKKKSKIDVSINILTLRHYFYEIYNYYDLKTQSNYLWKNKPDLISAMLGLAITSKRPISSIKDIEQLFIEEIVNQMSNKGDELEKRTAATLIEELNLTSLIPTLKSLLRDISFHFFKEVAISAWKLRSYDQSLEQEIIELIKQAATSNNDNQKQTAAILIGNLNLTQLIPEFVVLIADGKWDISLTALNSAKQLKGPIPEEYKDRVIEVIKQAATSNNDNQKQAAAILIGNLNLTQLIPELILLAQDRNEDVRNTAISNLNKFDLDLKTLNKRNYVKLIKSNTQLKQEVNKKIYSIISKALNNEISVNEIKQIVILCY